MIRNVAHLKIRNFAVRFVVIFVGITFTLAAVTAEVVKVEITSREVVTNSQEHSQCGPYEVIKGMK
jgi:hypothetical protein